MARVIQPIQFMLKQLNISGNSMNNQNCLNATNCMIIGYYPLRGKAQMCRLLCQYMHLPYKELLFTPKTWQQFKSERKLNWTFQELPFLKDGDTIVTETYPICLYLLNKANKKNLLGANLLQEIRIDTEIWKTDPASYLLTSLVNHRDYTPEVKADSTQKLWSRYLNQKLCKLQKQASEPFFFQQLTLLDFYIYQTFFFLGELCPQKLNVFPKLMKICINFYNIPEIAAYQNSKKCIKEVCPIKFCINWRERCGKGSH